MSDPGPILVVCTGNICRSPMAEGLLRHALAGQTGKLKDLKVMSAGVAARTGEPVSEHTVTALRKVGIELGDKRARSVTQQLLDEASIVFGMTESHRSVIRMRARPPPPHLYLFREFMPPPAEKEISDPYGGPLKLYESARDEMVEAIPSIIAQLKTLLGEK